MTQTPARSPFVSRYPHLHGVVFATRRKLRLLAFRRAGVTAGISVAGATLLITTVIHLLLQPVDPVVWMTTTLLLACGATLTVWSTTPSVTAAQGAAAADLWRSTGATANQQHDAEGGVDSRQPGNAGSVSRTTSDDHEDIWLCAWFVICQHNTPASLTATEALLLNRAEALAAERQNEVRHIPPATLQHTSGKSRLAAPIGVAALVAAVTLLIHPGASTRDATADRGDIATNSTTTAVSAQTPATQWLRELATNANTRSSTSSNISNLVAPEPESAQQLRAPSSDHDGSEPSYTAAHSPSSALLQHPTTNNPTLAAGESDESSTNPVTSQSDANSKQVGSLNRLTGSAPNNPASPGQPAPSSNATDSNATDSNATQRSGALAAPDTQDLNITTAPAEPPLADVLEKNTTASRYVAVLSPADAALVQQSAIAAAPEAPAQNNAVGTRREPRP